MYLLNFIDDLFAFVYIFSKVKYNLCYCVFLFGGKSEFPQDDIMFVDTRGDLTCGWSDPETLMYSPMPMELKFNLLIRYVSVPDDHDL